MDGASSAAATRKSVENAQRNGGSKPRNRASVTWKSAAQKVVKKYRRDPAGHYARKLKWDKAHPEYLRHQLAMYRARLAQATPPWLTKAQLADIRAIYAGAQKGEEVDHVIPLRGKVVCGLHVPWNLQVLPRAANRSKGNSFNG